MEAKVEVEVKVAIEIEVEIKVEVEVAPGKAIFLKALRAGKCKILFSALRTENYFCWFLAWSTLVQSIQARSEKFSAVLVRLVPVPNRKSLTAISARFGHGVFGPNALGLTL